MSQIISKSPAPSTFEMQAGIVDKARSMSPKDVADAIKAFTSDVASTTLQATNTEQSSVGGLDSISIPSGARYGDVAIHFDVATGTGPADPPNGFTTIFNDSFNTGLVTVFQNISYRVLGEDEGGTSVTGMGANFTLKSLLIYRPNIPAASVSVSQLSQEASATAPTDQTVDGSTETVPIIIIGSAISLDDSSGSVSPDNNGFDMTPATNMNKLDNSNYFALHGAFNSDPADSVTFSLGDAVDLNWLASAALTIR